MNILILTIIALVLIAAGYELCRPKDHGEYESRPAITYVDNTDTQGSIKLSIISDVCSDIDVLKNELNRPVDFGFLDDYSKAFNIPSHEFAHKPDLSDLPEQRKKMIEEMMPPDYRKAFDLCLADMEARETKGKLNL